MNFGLHLTIDCYCDNCTILNNSNQIILFLNQIVSLIKMTPISKPFYVNYNGGKKKDEYGISAIILIAESHISIHTFPEKQYFNMDVFSCKIFNSKKVLKYIKKYFNCKKIEYHIIKRGKNYPKIYK